MSFTLRSPRCLEYGGINIIEKLLRRLPPFYVAPLSAVYCSVLRLFPYPLALSFPWVFWTWWCWNNHANKRIVPNRVADVQPGAALMLWGEKPTMSAQEMAAMRYIRRYCVALLCFFRDRVLLVVCYHGRFLLVHRGVWSQVPDCILC